MTKRWKGKWCVYCGKVLAETEDHVFAREFFLVKNRGNLPKVPACRRCNNDKSLLEHYLTTVLAFGGVHADALETLRTMVPTRLERNAKLRKELESGFTGDTLPFDGAKLQALFDFVTKGLLWHHWETLLQEGDRLAVTMIQAAGVDPMRATLSQLPAADRVSVTLGAGTFAYQGMQVLGSPRSTVWWYQVYGGAFFRDTNGAPASADSLILAISGPPSFLPGFWEGLSRKRFQVA